MVERFYEIRHYIGNDALYISILFGLSLILCKYISWPEFFSKCIIISHEINVFSLGVCCYYSSSL